MGLGRPSSKPLIETIESHGLAEDVYDVIGSLLASLKECLRALPPSPELRVVYVGARVGPSGAVECALASSGAAVPADVNDCAVTAISGARFRPPKRGYGLLSIPLEVFGRR